MFEGSENVGKGEHFILVLNNGGGMNGTTNEDRTTYFEELPKNQLDLGLFLESDRMRALNDHASEPRQPAQRRAGGAPPGHRQSALRPGASSNRQPLLRQFRVQAFDDRIDDRSERGVLDDVNDFFRIYYAPNNAVLTLVGDFDPDEALVKVKKYFGSIPAQPAPPKVDLRKSRITASAAKRSTIRWRACRKSIMAYHIPAGQHAGKLCRATAADHSRAGPEFAPLPAPGEGEAARLVGEA